MVAAIFKHLTANSYKECKKNYVYAATRKCFYFVEIKIRIT